MSELESRESEGEGSSTPGALQTTVHRKPFYDLSARVLTGFFRIYCRATWHGRENVPVTGPLIIASNHASFFDPPLIGCSLPREICYLARESLFRFGPFAKIITALNSIPVDRDGGGARGLKMILAELMAGRGILLFPEGTRTSDGELLPAQPGIGLTILKSDAPVVPVYIQGSFDSWSRRHKFPRPKKVSIHFGKPVDFSEMRRQFSEADRSSKKGYYLMAARKTLDAIAAIRDEIRSGNPAN